MVLKITVGNEETLRKQKDPLVTLPPAAPELPDPFANGADPFSAPASGASGEDPFANGADPFAGTSAPPSEASQEGAVSPTGKPTGLREAKDMTQLEQVTGGFSHEVASWLGVPVGAVDKALGTMGLDAFQNGKNAEPAIENLMKHLGIDARAMKDPTLLNRVGSETVDAAVWTAAAVGGAGLLAAKTGVSAVPLLGKFISFLTKSPAKTIGLGAAAAPGATVGGEVAKNTLPDSTAIPATGAGFGIGRAIGGPFGGLVGAGIGLGLGGAADIAGYHVPAEVTGQFAGGAASTGVANRVGRMVTQPFGFLGRLRSPVEAEALRPMAADIEVPKQYAVDQIAGDLQQVDTEVSNAIQSVPRKGPPEVWATKVRAKIEKIRKVAGRVEDRMWARVPKKVSATASMPILTDFVKVLRKELVQGSPRAFPDRFVEEIEGIMEGTKPTLAPNGRVMKQGQPVTIGRLLALRSDLETSIRAGRVAAASGDARITPGLVGNWERLSAKVLETIEAAAPGNVALQQARDYTKSIHDMFSRGPLGNLLKRTKQGGDMVSDADTVDALLRSRGGPEAVSEASRAFAPGGKLTSTAMRPVNTTLSKDFEDTVRTMYRETIPVGTTPEQANALTQKFIDSHLPTLRTFSGVADDMNDASQRIAAALSRKADIETSALQKYAQKDASIAIKGIFTNPNPTATARELMGTFRNDPAALSGLKGGMLDELLTSTRSMGTRLQASLAPHSKLRGAFEAVFSPQEMARLDRIVKLGVELEGGEGLKASRILRSGGVVAARILFAQLGRGISRFTGGGTIQTPAITANIGKTLAEKAFGFFRANEIIKAAVTDPTWEKFLYSRVPGTLREAKMFNLHLRRLLTASETARQQLFERQ